MDNKIKYQPQVWGEPIAGERLSTNGHYTGEHISTVIQDAKDEASNVAHVVEEGIVNLGTVMQDAVEGSTPEPVTEEE